MNINGFWFSIDKRDDLNMYEVECATGEGHISTIFESIEECRQYVAYWRETFDYNVDMMKAKGKKLEMDYNNYKWSRE